jgi:hypothetical protein
MNQKELLEKFCEDKEYFSIVYDTKHHDFGKLINKEDLYKLNLDDHEIYTSINFNNNDVLFHMNMVILKKGIVVNPVRTLIESLANARIVEEIYPKTFNWRFNGENVEAYAIINSSNQKIQGTIARYGGTTTFLKVIKFRLRNIIKMYNNIPIKYNFNRNSEIIKRELLATGSINFRTKNYCIPIDIKWSWVDILKASKSGTFMNFNYKSLDINYWRREINPDLMSDTERIKITDPVETDLTFKKYPPCIQNITKMKIKGDEGRYILIRYFLSIHKPNDAKFLLSHLITDSAEKEHVYYGNSKGQFKTVLNNLDRYKDISCTRLAPWCDKTCPLSNPYEGIIKDEKQNENE